MLFAGRSNVGGVPTANSCPCGLPAGYDACCGRYHRGAAAPTAEALMRSRFTAFALGDAAYLRDTWDPATRPARVEVDPRLRWTRLEVTARTGGGFLAAEGTVAFVAHHVGGALAEDSVFRRVDGRWVYVGPT